MMHYLRRQASNALVLILAWHTVRHKTEKFIHYILKSPQYLIDIFIYTLLQHEGILNFYLEMIENLINSKFYILVDGS